MICIQMEVRVRRGTPQRTLGIGTEHAQNTGLNQVRSDKCYVAQVKDGKWTHDDMDQSLGVASKRTTKKKEKEKVSRITREMT